MLKVKWEINNPWGLKVSKFPISLHLDFAHCNYPIQAKTPRTKAMTIWNFNNPSIGVQSHLDETHVVFIYELENV